MSLAVFNQTCEHRHMSVITAKLLTQNNDSFKFKIMASSSYHYVLKNDVPAEREITLPQ